MLRKFASPSAELQKPFLPYGTLYPTMFVISVLAQELFHGISGMYDFAEPYVAVFSALQYCAFVPA
jgi:hypothetical protein